jgi:hypothetical protein
MILPSMARRSKHAMNTRATSSDSYAVIAWMLAPERAGALAANNDGVRYSGGGGADVGRY